MQSVALLELLLEIDLCDLRLNYSLPSVQGTRNCVLLR